MALLCDECVGSYTIWSLVLMEYGKAHPLLFPLCFVPDPITHTSAVVGRKTLPLEPFIILNTCPDSMAKPLLSAISTFLISEKFPTHVKEKLSVLLRDIVTAVPDLVINFRPRSEASSNTSVHARVRMIVI